MELFEASWRRSGFGDSDDEQQFRDRAVAALERYWLLDRQSESRPVWFERSFAFRLGPHLLRGRVDRVDRHPDGSYELIDYKTGKAKSAQDLREDVQLSLYQMGARESWKLETSAQSYFYVLTGEKVPVKHSEEELDRVKATVARSPAESSSRSSSRPPRPRSAASATTGSSARRRRSRPALSAERGPRDRPDAARGLITTRATGRRGRPTRSGVQALAGTREPTGRCGRVLVRAYGSALRG